DINLHCMATILGNILGILLLIFGIIFAIRIGSYILNFDYDAPLIKTEIEITFDHEEMDKENSDGKNTDGMMG
ncbi:MAG: hypothetical protein K2H94_00890, partial [Duncaniella sp.]|nr:hypothetical protein [Duncaniella sp.]